MLYLLCPGSRGPKPVPESGEQDFVPPVPPPPPPLRKVLPDWISHLQAQEQMLEAEKDGVQEMFADPLERLFRLEQVNEAAKQRREKKTADQLTNGLASNRHLAMALDNALRNSLGLYGFAVFMPERRPEPLAKHERRYFYDLPELQLLAGTSSRRACVLNELTGQTRVEVPRLVAEGALQRPCVHMALDQGSRGLQATHWLLHRGIRGTATEDRRALCSVQRSVLHCLGNCGALAFQEVQWHRSAAFAASGTLTQTFTVFTARVVAWWGRGGQCSVVCACVCMVVPVQGWVGCMSIVVDLWCGRAERGAKSVITCICVV